MDYVDLQMALRLSDELIRKSMKALQALEDRNMELTEKLPRGNMRRRVNAHAHNQTL